jgi:hypothetical protein
MKKSIFKVFAVTAIFAFAMLNMKSVQSTSGNANSLSLQNIVALSVANAEDMGANCGDICTNCQCILSESESGICWVEAYPN